LSSIIVAIPLGLSCIIHEIQALMSGSRGIFDINPPLNATVMGDLIEMCRERM